MGNDKGNENGIKQSMANRYVDAAKVLFHPGTYISPANCAYVLVVLVLLFVTAHEKHPCKTLQTCITLSICSHHRGYLFTFLAGSPTLRHDVHAPLLFATPFCNGYGKNITVGFFWFTYAIWPWRLWFIIYGTGCCTKVMSWKERSPSSIRFSRRWISGAAKNSWQCPDQCGLPHLSAFTSTCSVRFLLALPVTNDTYEYSTLVEA